MIKIDSGIPQHGELSKTWHSEEEKASLREKRTMFKDVINEEHAEYQRGWRKRNKTSNKFSKLSIDID